MAEEYSQEFKEKVLSEFETQSNMTKVARSNHISLPTLNGWL